MDFILFPNEKPEWDLTLRCQTLPILRTSSAFCAMHFIAFVLQESALPNA
jgi:hypothetical protein